MSYLLGIDAGTTTIKAALFDPVSGVLASASVDCPASYQDAGIAEIDMDRYWYACKKCILAISQSKGQALKNVGALCISSQGVTFVPIDRNGKELRRGIVYYDTRAATEAQALVDRFGEERLFNTTGQPGISALYEAPKLMWIREHEPECFQEIYKLLLVHDYLVFRFTGELVCVPPLMSSSLLFDLKHRDWWHEMLDFIGLPEEKLPALQDSGSLIGTVMRDTAEETGIPESAVVTAGAIDQVCGMLGVGNIREGIVSESTGSVLAVHTVSRNMLGCMDAGIHNFCNAIGTTYALIGVCPTAGSALNWFKDGFCETEIEEAKRLDRSVYELLDREAGQVPAGSEGLIMLPHLTGRGSPKPNPLAKGVFYGLRLHHRKHHFTRAVLESVAYMLRSNLDTFRSSGIEIQEIRSFGGGSRSGLWNQIKADVCGLPVVASHSHEPGCIGAAILAGVGSGVFESIDEACKTLVRPGKPHYPDEITCAAYRPYFEEYKKLNDLLEPLFE